MKKRLMPVFLCVFLMVLVVCSSLSIAANNSIVLKVEFRPNTPENKVENDTLMDKVKRFEAKYPNIKCQPVYFDYTNRQDFFVMQASKTAPDVLTDVWATEGNMLAQKGWALPLDGYLKKWDKTNWLNADALALYKVRGKIYGIPRSGYVKNILYNKKMFRAKNVPFPKMNWTWKDFIDTAVKLTDKKNGVAGYAPFTKSNEGGWQFTDFIYQAGGEIEQNKKGKYYAVFDSPEAIRGAQFIKDMKWKYDIVPANWSIGFMDAYNLFGSEKAAMVSHPEWPVEWVINTFKWDPKDVGMVPMPKGDGPKGRQAGVQGGQFMIINGLTDKKVRDAAWKWLTFELWDDNALTGIQAQINDFRTKKQYMAQLRYPILKTGVGYQKKEDDLRLANPDVCVTWDEEFRNYLPKTGHAEPEIECQTLYGQVFAPIFQALYSDPNADPEKLLKEANAKFQKEYLDPYNNQKH